jgi:hypothetical protein
LSKQGNPLLRFLWGEAGAHAVRRDPVRKLPGLGWFDRVTRSRQDSLERLGTLERPLSAIAASD